MARQAESGFTLIELIVTIAILGIAFAVFVGGMGTSIIGADVHRKQATSETVLRRFAESVKGSLYLDCATTAAYGGGFAPPPAPTTTVVGTSTTQVPPGFTASVTGIKYWNGGSNTFLPACPSDQGLQLLTLRVAANDGRDTETVEIVKRRP